MITLLQAQPREAKLSLSSLCLTRDPTARTAEAARERVCVLPYSPLQDLNAVSSHSICFKKRVGVRAPRFADQMSVGYAESVVLLGQVCSPVLPAVAAMPGPEGRP